MPTDAKIAELHQAYCQATGFDLPLRMGRDRVWFDFDKAGFTTADLLLVIAWVKRQCGVARSGYSAASLRFSTLLQLDYFEEKLHLAKMEQRSRQRRPPIANQVQHVGDVTRTVEVRDPGDEPQLAGPKAAAMLREWRENQLNPQPSSK